MIACVLSDAHSIPNRYSCEFLAIVGFFYNFHFSLSASGIYSRQVLNTIKNIWDLYLVIHRVVQHSNLDDDSLLGNSNIYRLHVAIFFCFINSPCGIHDSPMLSFVFAVCWKPFAQFGFIYWNVFNFLHVLHSVASFLIFCRLIFDAIYRIVLLECLSAGRTIRFLSAARVQKKRMVLSMSFLSRVFSSLFFPTNYKLSRLRTIWVY